MVLAHFDGEVADLLFVVEVDVDVFVEFAQEGLVFAAVGEVVVGFEELAVLEVFLEFFAD